MPARLHLVRHGEVDNPERILYGRLPGYPLTERGHRMAAMAAESLDRPVARVYASPLERAQQSAAPWVERAGVDLRTEHRIIEPTNAFEGKALATIRAMRDPAMLRLVWNPFLPTWGEPYRAIAARVEAAMTDALDEVAESGDEGDVVLVSHQAPIWITHRHLAGQRLWHDPRARRCALSSITTFERVGGRLTEVGYADPAASIDAIDLGAV
ncbi:MULTISPECIES: histidine phosphatase family protein [unclassified Agrococcus]|uniref:histidine phosphatase family protein n=1 Tax=unclassified Agrococcus TaxID=2615065 RepID=UPI00361FC78A